MSIIDGIVLIVLIIGVFAFLSLNVAMSDREGTYYPVTPKSHYPGTPMWTTITTYGPKCHQVEVTDDSLIKLCMREEGHAGACQHKVIDLGGPGKNDEELS